LTLPSGISDERAITTPLEFGVAEAVGVGVAEAVAEAVGVGVGVGVGVAVAVAVAEGVGVGEGVAEAVGVGEGVAEAVGEGAGVAEAVGEGAGVATGTIAPFFHTRAPFDFTQLYVYPRKTIFWPTRVHRSVGPTSAKACPPKSAITDPRTVCKTARRLKCLDIYCVPAFCSIWFYGNISL